MLKIKEPIDLIQMLDAAMGILAKAIRAKGYSLMISFGNSLVGGLVNSKDSPTRYRPRLSISDSLSGRAVETGK